MGVSCPLCLNTEAFNSLHNLYNALAQTPICPICKTKPSENTLADHLLNAHLQSSTNTDPPSPPPVMNAPDPLDELLKDFTEFVQSEEVESKVEVKMEEPKVSDDANFKVFQAALSENTDSNTSGSSALSPPTNAVLAAVTSPPSLPSKSVQCNICGWNFDNNNFLQLHLVLMHSDRRSYKQEQQQVSDLPKEYKCRFCANVSYDSFNDYVHHVQSVHNDYRYVCHICSRMFKLRGSLLVHHRVVHTTARVVTSHLSREIPEEEAMSPPEGGNESSPSPPKKDGGEEVGAKYKCSQCKKTFKREYHLNQHTKVHENRFWDCEVCQKSFTTKYFLKKHMRLHTGETPYSCTICGKSFTFQQSYHKHMLYHTDEKPYHCSQCGRAFKELSTLQNHERIHSGERPFACETCGKSFRQRVSYLVHRRIHTGVMPYSCEACGKSFRYKVTQRTHKCPNGGGSPNSLGVPEASVAIPNKTELPILPPSIKDNLQKFRQQVHERRKNLQQAKEACQSPGGLIMSEKPFRDEGPLREASQSDGRLVPNLPLIPLNLEDILKDVCLYS